MAGVCYVIRALPKSSTNYAKFLRTSVAAYSSPRNSTNLPELRNAQIIETSRSFSTHQVLQQPFKSENNKVDIGEGSWKEIYEGILSTQVRMVKLFSLSTSMMGVAMQPIIAQKLGSSVGLVVAVGSFVGFFTFVTPLLIHWLTKKYVMRIDYDPKTDMYSATTLSFFLREKKIQFSLDDVHVPDVPGMFTTFHAKGRPLFIEPSTFNDLEHYGRIMGYDKPIDYRLENDNEDSNKK